MKNIFRTSLTALSLIFLASCVDSSSNHGLKSSSGAGGVNQNEVIEPDGSNVQGKYAAEIWPVNANLHLKTIGWVGVEREGDSFRAMVRLKYGPKGTRVKQAFYTSRRCPNINDDLNKDAYIDILEAKIAIGKVVIPFDGNLDSQSAGSGEWPSTDGTGKMFWTQSASFDRMFTDLKTADENPGDEIIKLKDEEGITLPGRIVLFQGIADTTPLPDTVATSDGESNRQSLPVGCAILWKVDSLPAELTGTGTVTP